MAREEIITCTLRDVPGCDGKYRANPQGQVVRVYESGKMKLMSQYLSHKKFVVKLTKNGTSKEIPVGTVILLTFRGLCPKGMVPYHKNGIKSDNWLDNLGYISQEELGAMTGRKSRSQSVMKLDRDGVVVDVYYSAREAARKNHMSYQTVTDRCNGRVKRPFALDGHTYVWEDKAVSMRHALRTMELK